MRTRSFLVLMILAITATSTSALTPAHLWSRGFGGTYLGSSKAVVVDASGNIYVTGSFDDPINLGGGNLVSGGLLDIFVAKYDATGVHQWSQRFGGGSDDVANSIAVDASGNVYVTGSFYQTVNFGGSNLVSAGGPDVFLAKFNAAGAHQWSQRFGGADFEECMSVAVGIGGRVLVTGRFLGTAAFGGGNLVSAGWWDVFLASYDLNGVHQWSQRFGSTGLDAGTAVAVDASGNVNVAGRFDGTVDFGGGGLVSAGDSDVFLARYSAAGAYQWSQRGGGAGADGASSLALDASGNAIATGFFSGTANFGGGNLVSAGEKDIFVAKFNAAGTHQWSRRSGGTLNDEAYGVAADALNNVFLTGIGEAVFDVSQYIATDMVLASYSATGALRWSQRFAATDTEEGVSLAADGSNGVLVTGNFFSQLDLGGGDLSFPSSRAIFLAKFASEPEQPVIGSIRDVVNDQGRRVRIQFTRSGHDDTAASSPVTQYEAYRMNTQAAMMMPFATSSRAQLVDQGWVYAGSVPAHAVSGYVMDAPTDGDSTVAFGPYNSVFFIRAAQALPATYFDSSPDTGYSVDNLSPAVPQNVVYAEGELKWKKSTDADFDYFSIYGANTNSFAAATAIDYTVTPALNVAASPYAYYFVTATDFSGNEGKPAVVNALSGAGGAPSSYVLSISSYPNPFNPETSIRYTVPSKGRVTITIYDARGARVATLLDEDRPGGAYTQPWNGTDDAGKTVSSGVYFARIEHNGSMRSRKVVLLK